ncbi:protein HUA2-LIKE 1 isoform X2 [Drosophila eugracilis]|uniref:protein HUA2-LIKE 1 isoform X2 n=1 Tax=Drosophila eugracilis TaxID=29029 RepID=UPI0007E60457|nr:protein HUA2-LIKE 1 isoform X2 [Drosophila eugracilis]
MEYFGIYLILATAVLAQEYRKFGLNCEDIACKSGQKCIISRVPCNSPHQREGEQCGTYPECETDLLRFRRSPQMPYQPVGVPAPMPPGYPPPRPFPMQKQQRQAVPQYALPPPQPNPQYAAQYQAINQYAMQGQGDPANPQLLFSVGMSYPSYMNYYSSSAGNPSTSFYSPYLPNYNYYYYNVNLPFLGGS